MEIIDGKEFQRRASASFKKQYEEAREVELMFNGQEFIPQLLARPLGHCGYDVFKGENPPFISHRPPNEKDEAPIGQIWIWRNEFYECQEHAIKKHESFEYGRTYVWNRIVTPRDSGKALKNFGCNALTLQRICELRSANIPESEWDQIGIEEEDKLRYKKVKD